MSRTRLTGTVVAGLTLLCACGGGGGGQDATGDLDRLATASAEEFTSRGEGTFFDAGFASYCRAGTGFDEGPFAAVGFAPIAEGYEFCYNVSSDLKQVALAATSMRDGTVQCLILDASSGQVQRGEITDKSPCTP